LKHVTHLLLYLFSLGFLNAGESAFLVTTQGEFPLVLEVVKTPKALQDGLMFRKHVPDNHGMLFVFEAPHNLCFWMKNTYVPLDILHFDDRGVVVELMPAMKPHDLSVRCAKALGLAALEFPAGSIKKFNVQVGDRLKHDSFKSDAK